ncbi:hypothetical protein [Methylobacterium sp. Gmos1]
MRLLLATALLALAAGTAAAQTEAPAMPGSAGIAAPDAAAPATGRRQPRRVDGAGAGAAKPTAAKADPADSLRKAQAATAARDKAWDARMKRTLGSICHGC